MRKLYTLGVGLVFILASLKTTGQTATLTNATCRANFEISPSPNSPLSKKFIAIPWHSDQKRPVYICWKFGDGTDTCIQYSNTYPGPYTVVHHYQRPGIYEVCVKIVYQGGCEARKCKEVIAGEACKADFEKLALASTINPLYVSYKAIPWHSDNKKPKTICWKFGDGKDTCIEYPANYTGLYIVRHKYTEPGLYEVCVKITYYGGCEAAKCKRVQVGRREQCKADFVKLPVTTANNPLTAAFKAFPWHSNNKKPKIICWKFGDGRDTCIEYNENYSGQYIVRHTYREPGNYEVCVKIKYYGGCEASKCKHIQIGRPDECKADFVKIPVINPDHPLVAGFKALPSHNNNKKPRVICWSFGDGRDTCVEYAQNFSGPYVIRHRYNAPGTYTVCVKIAYYGGCEARKCKPVIIPKPDECRADFEKLPVSTVNDPLLVYYKALPWNSNNKKPKVICWKFGDGRDTCIEYSANYTGSYLVRHRYNEPGNYEVCVKILYYGGCEAGKCKNIQVGHPPLCRADFEKLNVTPVNNPLTTVLKAIPWHANDKKPRVICWTFGDGRDTCIEYSENYSGPYIVTHTYREPGNYEVCVKIRYYGGCEAAKCHRIKVEGQGECKVKLFEITPSVTSLVRGFYVVPWSSNGKRPLRICWYFGDGTDTCIMLNQPGVLPWGLFIRHTYPAPGVYRACVKILYEGGCIAADCKEVIIRPNTNVCGGYLTDTQVSTRTFKFRGFAIHNPNDPVIGYSWTFGDGTGATGREVTHTYNHSGTYEVCLTIKTQRGCVTRICKKITVPGNALPALQLTPNPAVNVLHALFYSTSTEPVTIKIVNGYGVVVRNYIRNATAGENNWDFDVATLIQGSYTLSVQSPGQLSSGLFIKQ
jgi:PKD repeat protein